MKNIIKITILLFFAFGFTKADFPEIFKIDTLSKWEKRSDFTESDITVDARGLLKDYDDFTFLKFKYVGWFINKYDGSIFRKIYMDTTSINFKFNQSWDLSQTDSSRIFLYEFARFSSDNNTLYSEKLGDIDTLMKWETVEKDLYPRDITEHFFYAITDDQFLDQHGNLIRNGNYTWYKIIHSVINIANQKVEQLPNVDMRRAVSNGNIFAFTTPNFEPSPHRDKDYPDTHEFYNYESGSFNKLNSLVIYNSNWFKEIINDSVCITLLKDSIELFNFRNGNRYSIHPTQDNENPIGAYWDEGRKTVNVAFGVNGDSTKIMSIHYPSKNLIKNEKVIAPYLGRFVMNTGDGYTLSVGHGGYLYKHDLSVFETDSLKSEFSFKNTANYELQFSDESFGAIIDWQWNFGDGSTSIERHPIHKFASAGNYDVELIVTDEYGYKDTITKQVKVTQKLNASFDFDLFSGQAPFTVQFKNYSSENAVRYIWNFGDGTYSYEMEPAHTYTIPGQYSVSLTAVDEYENFNTFVQPKKVVVTE